LSEKAGEGYMSEKVKVGMHGQVIIPKKLRKKYHIQSGTTLEIDETEDGLLLKTFNPIAEMKGIGKGVFGDPIEYQKKLRNEDKEGRATA
jgi:AbrB family looped-hinge helix DNA binding protein